LLPFDDLINWVVDVSTARRGGGDVDVVDGDDGLNELSVDKDGDNVGFGVSLSVDDPVVGSSGLDLELEVVGKSTLVVSGVVLVELDDTDESLESLQGGIETIPTVIFGAVKIISETVRSGQVDGLDQSGPVIRVLRFSDEQTPIESLADITGSLNNELARLGSFTDLLEVTESGSTSVGAEERTGEGTVKILDEGVSPTSTSPTTAVINTDGVRIRWVEEVKVLSVVADVLGVANEDVSVSI